MKVALCLSGQPRNVEIGFNKLKNTILDTNDVDVFVHTWYDPENLSTRSIIPGRENNIVSPDADKKILDLYQPKAYKIEKPKKWKDRSLEFTDRCFDECWSWGKECGVDLAKDYLVDAVHSMWYSIMISNQLREEYSLDNGVKYDLVIRNRFDYGPHVRLYFGELEVPDNVIFYQELNQPKGMVSDWFNMGSSNAMNIFSSIYYNIGQLHKQSIERDGIWCNELLTKHQIINNSLESQPIDFRVHY
jgi:hypothetical protein